MLKTRLCRRGALGAVLIGAALLPAGANAATLPTLNVTIGKGTIAVSGATVSGAVNVVTTAAKGLKEPSTALFALKPGVTFAEFQAFTKSKAFADPDNATKLGSLVFDAEGAGGGTSEAQTVLTPGNYVALNPEGEKPSNVAMVPFTVTASTAPAALPAPQATIKTIEFGFRGPHTLKVGELVRFENEGFLAHMDIAIPMKSKFAAVKGIHYLLKGQERKAFRLVAGQPSTLLGLVTPGGFQQQTVAARPGWYIEACFMDTQDGREHTRLGMETLLHIVK